MRNLSLLAVIGLGVPGITLAQDAVPEPGPIAWKLYIGAGPTLAPKTDLIVKYQGQSLASDTTKDKTSLSLSAELEAAFHPVFSGSFIAEYAPYKYKSGGKSDTEMSFFIMPKARTNFGLWAGVGVGIINTSLGDSSETDGTTTITYDDKSVTSFALSPRIGYDTQISENLTLGAFIAYTTTSSDLSASIVDPTLGVNDKLTAEFERKWFTLAVRAGFLL